MRRESFNDWARKNVNFLESKCEPGSTLSAMHSLALNIENLMKKFYEKDVVSMVLFEALKFCV